MWMEIKQASNKMVAEMWKEFFEGEGIPARMVPEPLEAGMAEAARYRIYVPRSKVHVAQEVLRKL